MKVVVDVRRLVNKMNWEQEVVVQGVMKRSWWMSLKAVKHWCWKEWKEGGFVEFGKCRWSS